MQTATLADVLWVLGGVAVTSGLIVAVVAWAWSETRAARASAPPPAPDAPTAARRPLDDSEPPAR